MNSQTFFVCFSFLSCLVGLDLLKGRGRRLETLEIQFARQHCHFQVSSAIHVKFWSHRILSKEIPTHYLLVLHTDPTRFQEGCCILVPVHFPAWNPEHFFRFFRGGLLNRQINLFLHQWLHSYLANGVCYFSSWYSRPPSLLQRGNGLQSER